MTRQVKICGLTTPEAVDASAEADYIGFVFFAGSPRNVTPQAAATLAARSILPAVAVTVNPSNTLLEMIFNSFRPAYLQLHGTESPARVSEIKYMFQVSVIKAFAVSSAFDIDQAQSYESVADRLMFDAKALSDDMPGGNGIAFDWKLLSKRSFTQPWFLSGGLSADNVEKALRISKAPIADVSTSVESRPGIKDPERVRAFIKKVKKVK